MSLNDTTIETVKLNSVVGQAIAGKLGRWSRGGASAERMYRTLTDPGYHRATNKHGRRLNKRGGTPMHVMAAHALRQLPGMAGNLTQARARLNPHPQPSTLNPGTLVTRPKLVDMASMVHRFVGHCNSAIVTCL